MVLIRNEEAVSPVIGTILMVAVTVILAAIIAMYVFGLPSNVTKTNIIAATAQLDINGAILITYQGGQDDDKLLSLNITAPDSSMWYTSDENGGITPSLTPGTSVKPKVGAVMKLDPNSAWPSTGPKHVAVIAAFANGPNQVILDTYL